MLDQSSRAKRSLQQTQLCLCLLALMLAGSSAFGQDVSPSAKNGQAKRDAPVADTGEIMRARRATDATEDKKSATSETATVEELRVRIEEARPGAGRAALQRRLIDRLVETNRKADALDELRLMIHEDRFDPAFFYNTGNALARLGDATAAVDAYRKAISQRRGHYSYALNNLGVILLRQGRWDEAQDALLAALMQEHNTYAEASYNLGRLHLLRGETGQAIREWTRTLKLQPDHTDAAAALARAYAEDGNPRRGLSVIEAYAARNARISGGVPASLTYARREIVEATNVEKNEATSVEKKDDEEPAAARTTNRRSKDDKEPAATALATNRPKGVARSAPRWRAYEVDQKTYELLQSAREAREQGKNEVAIKQYRNVIERSSRDYFAPANLELGFALINLQRRAEAVEALRVVAEKDGARYPIAHFHLGRLYEQLGQLDLSARHFNRAVELYGDQNPQATLYLSSVYEKQGDHKGALAAMESYMQMIEQQGSIPPWATERLAKLKEKAAAPAQGSMTKP